MEVYTMMRPDPPFPGLPTGPDYAFRTYEETVVPGFFRSEPSFLINNLPSILPRMQHAAYGLTIHAEQSFMRPTQKHSLSQPRILRMNSAYLTISQNS